jgi:hypothetical protein
MLCSLVLSHLLFDVGSQIGKVVSGFRLVELPHAPWFFDQ